MRRDRRWATLGGLALAALAASGGPPVRAQVAPEDLRTLEAVAAQLNSVVASAERSCLSSVETTKRRGFFSGISQDWGEFVRLGLSGGVEQRERRVRGAARDLPKALWSVQDDKIRTCIQAQVQPTFLAYGRVLERIAAGNLPALIGFRFDFQRVRTADRKRFTDQLVVHAQAPGQTVNQRISLQDPTGIPYFVQYFSLPQSGAAVSGIIAAEAASSQLTSAPPILTNFCFQKAPGIVPAGVSHDYFTCPEGGVCRPSPLTTRLLRACPNPPPSASAVPKVWRASYQREGASPAAVSWSVPSIETLSGQGASHTGYSIFTLEDQTFRDMPQVTSVVVGLKVNGVAVNEDGVPPELRPVKVELGGPLSYSFALQTLNFAGARRGCEDIEVSLTPLLEDGRRGPTRVARLDYVAFRDVAPRPAAGDGPGLTWSATYIRPAEAWRNMLILNSYSYPFASAGAQEAAIAKAQADKAWLDAQGFVYNGQPVVGAIRPPRILQPDGSAAYGLMAALRQPSGQLRLVSTYEAGKALAGYLKAQRGRSPRAAQVIDKAPFVLAAGANIMSLPGVCEN